MILLINLILATPPHNNSQLETVVVHRQYDDDIEIVDLKETIDFDMIFQNDLHILRRPLYDVDTINNIEILEEVAEDNVEEESVPCCDAYLKFSMLFIFVVALVYICIYFSIYIYNNKGF